MRELWNNRITRYGGILALLILLNVVSYIWRNWGLITVNVDDAPLSKIIRSIEWQGWVKIYTNLPLDQKVTMHVDHVPLAEAMATLAATVNGPANGAPPPEDRANRPDRGNRGDRPDAGRPPPTADNNPPPQQGLPGLPAASVSTPAPTGLPGLPAASVPQPQDGNTVGAPGGQGGGGRGGFPRGGGGFGGGGFGGGGGGATWNLAFFVGSSKSEVKQEIQAFEDGTARTNDNLKVYSYPTPVGFMGNNDQPSAADPRKQSWAGYKEPPAPPPPAPSADGQPAPTPAAPTAPTTHTYLQAFAAGADIWIMAPGDWDNATPTPPPANSSIISAVKNFVSGSKGYVTQAIILRMGTGGPRGNRQRGDMFSNMDEMADRMRNAINGLPPDERADATDQLNQEVAFMQTVRAAPAEQRMQMMQQHMTDRIADNPNGPGRRTPEKRAQRYQRMVSNRQASQGASAPHGATASGGHK